MSEESIRKRLENELLKKVREEVKSNRRLEYEGKLREYDARYRARRSIKGLLYTGIEDPEIYPLDDPFDGCADIGHPVELTLTQELVPNVMTAHMGATPFTESRKATEKGLSGYGEIDDFLYYAFTRAGVKRIRRKTLLSGYKYGEGIEKLIMVPEVRTVTESRLLMKSGDKILMGPDGNEVEVYDPMQDLFDIVKGMLEGDDPRSLAYRFHAREMPPKLACEAAGIEVKGEVGEQTMRVAELQQSQQDAPPVPDWANATTYKPEKVTVTEDISVNQWPKIVKIPTKDFVWPSEAESNDIMDYWVMHRYPVELQWLIERKKTRADDIEGFYPDIVDRIVERYKGKQVSEEKRSTESRLEPTRPEIWEVYGKFILSDDEDDPNYMLETEIIAWFCDEGADPLLGWMVNPGTRYEMHHIKPFFVFQPKPEDYGFHGLGIPETCTGFRDMADWLLNSRLNREALYGNPPLKMDQETFEHEQKIEMGFGKKWVVSDNGMLEVVDLQTGEGQNVADEQMLLHGLRLMWGAMEQMSGQQTSTSSGTLGEAQLLAAKGAQMFQDTVESISQVADLEYEYIRQYYLQNEPHDMKIPVRGEGGQDGQLIQITRNILEGPIIITSRRVSTEAERQMRLTAIQMAFNFLSQIQSPVMRIPSFQETALKEYFDALNLENMVLPTAQQIQSEMANILNEARQKEQADKYRKALDSIKNKGARDQVEQYLDRIDQMTQATPMAPGTPGGTGGPGGIQLAGGPGGVAGTGGPR